MGWVTPLGFDIETTWQRLLAGDCEIDYTTLFDASTFPSTFASEVRGFELADVLGADYEAHKTAARNAAFALGAAVQAWKASQLDKARQLDRQRIGIYLGAGEGPLDFDAFAKAAVDAWDHENNCVDTRKWAKGRLPGHGQDA